MQKLENRINELEKALAHWQNNHATEVRRARILKERIDLPMERVQAYEKWGEDLRTIAKLQDALYQIVEYAKGKTDETATFVPDLVKPKSEPHRSDHFREATKMIPRREPLCYLTEQWLHYEQSAEGMPGAFPVYADAPPPDAEITRLTEIVAEQKRTIEALNTCIGGEYTTSTDNLTRVTRLEEMVAKLAPDAERFRWLALQVKEDMLNPRQFNSESCPDTRLKWTLPTLVSTTCIGSTISFEGAVNIAMGKAQDKPE